MHFFVLEESKMKRNLRIALLILLLILLATACSLQEKGESTPNTTAKAETTATKTETTEIIITTTEAPDIVYEKAINCFQEGDLDEAQKLFLSLGDYEKSSDYLSYIELLNNVYGIYTWENQYGWRYIFEIGRIVKVADNDNRITEYNMDNYISVSADGEVQYVAKDYFGRYYFVCRNGDVYFKSVGSVATDRTEKDSNGDFKRLWRKYDGYGIPKEPAIGMTAEDVRHSTWGEPQKINTTTTAYHTTEQWCYSNYRYIYFEDGIVTSIQK